MNTMTVEHEHVHNVTLPSGDQGREYRNGRGKVIRVGDMIHVDSKSASYRVLDIRVERVRTSLTPRRTAVPKGVRPSPLDESAQVYVTAYGGPKGKMLTRTFHVDRCSRALKGEDNNESYRDAVHETSQASKSKRRGWM